VLLLLKVSEPFSTCLTLFLDELKDEDRGEQGGGALGTAVQLGQQLPALDGGDGALADGADFGVSLVDGLWGFNTVSPRSELGFYAARSYSLMSPPRTVYVPKT
jgi:hypothetical protein